MSIFDTFAVFDFTEGMPYVSVTKNGMTFNKSVMIKLKYPQYVQLLIDAESHRIAIRACEQSTEKACSFYKKDKDTETNKILSVRWNAKDLMSTITSLTGWNLSEHSYRVYGELYVEDQAMMFELDKAEEIE